MASITTNSTTASRGLISGIRSLFARMSDALNTAAEANTRFRQVERLRAMTDEQLAEHGIKRDEIVRVVFRDVFYL